MLFFICVFQENSEDDKKRGRSTDSEVSQVSLKTLKVPLCLLVIVATSCLQTSFAGFSL